MTSVQVFVDDAVRGDFPPVCAKTGTAAQGKFRIDQHRGGLGPAWLLVLLGPIGWIVLVLMLFTTRRVTLTIRLPYSEAAVERVAASRRGPARRVARYGGLRSRGVPVAAAFAVRAGGRGIAHRCSGRGRSSLAGCRSGYVSMHRVGG